MNKVSIMNDKFNGIIMDAVIDCGNKGDMQIIFDGEDFHAELILDRSFIRGYVIEQKPILAVSFKVKIANKHIAKCLDYFLKVESLEIELTP